MCINGTVTCQASEVESANFMKNWLQLETFCKYYINYYWSSLRDSYYMCIPGYIVLVYFKWNKSVSYIQDISCSDNIHPKLDHSQPVKHLYLTTKLMYNYQKLIYLPVS